MYDEIEEETKKTAEKLTSETQCFLYGQKGRMHQVAIYLSEDFIYFNCGKSKGLITLFLILFFYFILFLVRIEDISEIRRGHSTDILIKYGKPETEKNCISFICYKNKKMIDLELKTPEEAVNWENVVTLLMNIKKKHRGKNFLFFFLPIFFFFFVFFFVFFYINSNFFFFFYRNKFY